MNSNQMRDEAIRLLVIAFKMPREWITPVEGRHDDDNPTIIFPHYDIAIEQRSEPWPLHGLSGRVTYSVQQIKSLSGDMENPPEEWLEDSGGRHASLARAMIVVAQHIVAERISEQLSREQEAMLDKASATSDDHL